MKKKIGTMIAIVIIAILLSILYFEKSEVINSTVEITTEAAAKLPISEKQMAQIRELVKSNKLPMKEEFKDALNEVQEESFDFGKYLTYEQKMEIYKSTNRKTGDLPVEMDSHGNEYVDLKGRFDTVHVSVVDENGVTHTGEYALTKKPIR